MENIDKALALYPELPDTKLERALCHVNRGAVALAMRRRDDARAALETAAALLTLLPGMERDCLLLKGRAIGIRLKQAGEMDLTLDPGRAQTSTQGRASGEQDEEYLPLLVCRLVVPPAPDEYAAAEAFGWGYEALEMGMAERALDHLETAIALYEKIAADRLSRPLLSFDKSPNRLLALANCYGAMAKALVLRGDFTAAIAAFERAKSLCANEAEAGYVQEACEDGLAFARFCLGQLPESMRDSYEAGADEAVRVGDESFTGLSAGYFSLGPWQRALMAYERIPGTELKQADTRVRMAFLRIRRNPDYEEFLGQLGRALPLYKSVAGTDREQAICQATIGIGLIDLGMSEEGLEWLERAVTAFNGISSSQTGPRVKGLEPPPYLGVFEPAGDNDDDRAACLLEFGVALSKTGRYEEAIRSYRDALVIFERTKDAEGRANCHQHIAAALSSMGHHDEALTEAHHAFVARGRDSFPLYPHVA